MRLAERLRALLTVRRVVLALLALVVVAGGLWLFVRSSSWLSPAVLRATLARLGPWGPAALIAALGGVLVVPVLPASIFQIGAGLAFGPPLGLLYATIADILGASVGFWLARRWGQPLLSRFMTANTQSYLDRLAGRMTWRTVLLLRLLPGPAYPLVSLAAGYAPLPFWQYSLASISGVFPALALLVLAGDLVTQSPWLAFGLVVAVVASLALAGRLLGRAGAETT